MKIPLRNLRGLELAALLTAMILTAGVVTLILTSSTPDERGDHAGHGSWPASPFQSIPLYADQSHKIVVGEVLATTELEPSTNLTERRYAHYYATLRVHETLKGTSEDTVVVKIYHGEEPLGDLYRPIIEPGEQVLLFLSVVNDSRARLSLFWEDKIWRIEGDTVYNLWGRRMREIQQGRPESTRMPETLLESWGRTYKKAEFLDMVKKSILGENTGLWG